MPSRLRLDERRLHDRLQHGDPYWPAQLAVAAAVLLALTLSDTITVGPTWVMPAVEGALLAALVAILPRRATEHAHGRRHAALAVVGLVSLSHVVSLALLVHRLTTVQQTSGDRLLLSGVVLWTTSVLLFAVWYWELDRGGPTERFRNPDATPDFQFAQMENPQLAPAGWRPGFFDYLYTSLTNATAFSPTDTLPLTHTAKAVMALQSVSAFVTLALVVARAVNILG
jgi:uncharacterized membrane protein